MKETSQSHVQEHVLVGSRAVLLCKSLKDIASRIESGKSACLMKGQGLSFELHLYYLLQHSNAGTLLAFCVRHVQSQGVFRGLGTRQGYLVRTHVALETATSEPYPIPIADSGEF